MYNYMHIYMYIQVYICSYIIYVRMYVQYACSYVCTYKLMSEVVMAFCDVDILLVGDCAAQKFLKESCTSDR